MKNSIFTLLLLISFFSCNPRVELSDGLKHLSPSSGVFHFSVLISKFLVQQVYSKSALDKM